MRSCPEMEFLDINLIKSLSLLLHAITFSSISGLLENLTLLYSKNSMGVHTKKIRETRKLEPIHK
jgi:hypothetical protein